MSNAETALGPSDAPPSAERSGVTRAFLLGGLLPALTVPVLGLALYSSTGRDDAYLTYWPAYALASLGKIVNYNGARLEQSSSLLHTLVLAGGTKATGVAIPTLGYGLGILGGMLTVVLVWVVARVLVPSGAWLAALLAATSTPILYWSFGGLETTLVPALLLAALLTAVRFLAADETNMRLRLAVFAAVAIAFTMVRPETGPILIGVLVVLAVASLLLSRRSSEWTAAGVRRALVLAGVAAVAFAVLTLARLAYFGAAFPHPVSAKANGIQIGDGLDYLFESVKESSPWGLAVLGVALSILAVVGIIRIVRRPTPLGVLVATAAVLELGFVVLVGGDWMEGGRFLVSVAALAAVLAVVGIEAVPARAVIAVVVIALQVGGAVHFAKKSSTGAPAWATPSITGAPLETGSYAWFERQNRVHLRDTSFVDPLVRVIDALKPHVKGPVTVATGQAGMVPYYVFQSEYGHATLIDVRGIATDALSRCPNLEPTGPLGMGYGLSITLSGWLANEKQCGVKRPDVIFGLDNFTELLLDVQAQYQLVHQQRGRAVTHSRELPGELVPAREFIAVRKDLGRFFDPAQ
jgi:hypothetical protein